MRGNSPRPMYPQQALPSFMAPRQPIPDSKPQLPVQALYERVLELWHGGRHDTLSIARELHVDEVEVCRIIDECEGRGAAHV